MTNSMYQIVAMTESRGIGLNGNLPWSLKSELAYFSKVTTYYNRSSSDPPNVIIMGRKTWESINRPLKNRINIILSSKPSAIPPSKSYFVFSCLDLAMEFLTTLDHSSVFIIGGSSLYSQTLDICSTLFITKINLDIKCDTFYSEFKENWKKLGSQETMSSLKEIMSLESLVNQENGITFEYQIWNKI